MSREARDLEQVCRAEMGNHARILSVLEDGEKTVSEVADALSLPVSEVMVWMMGMRRYGLVVESAQPNDDDYFTYRIAARSEESAS